MTLIERIEREGQKKLLAIDGGGIRGVLALEVLQRIYTALSQGLRRASFITLWNGEPGDGPGGTQNMVELVRKLTGRQPVIIDPATL